MTYCGSFGKMKNQGFRKINQQAMLCDDMEERPTHCAAVLLAAPSDLARLAPVQVTQLQCQDDVYCTSLGSEHSQRRWSQ